MKWRRLIAGALASAIVGILASSLGSSLASAEVRIVGDPGGEVTAYLHKYRQIRDSGQRVIVDGPCLSACTLFTGIIPRNRVCVTRRAMLGFHAASYYDDATRSLVPTRAGSRLVMRLYPPDIRRWIRHNGGLTPHIIELRGRELDARFQALPVDLCRRLHSIRQPTVQHHRYRPARRDASCWGRLSGLSSRTEAVIMLDTIASRQHARG